MRSHLACSLEWLLGLVSILAIQGLSLKEADTFTLTMEPGHYRQVDLHEVPEVNILCILRDASGNVVPLAECVFKEHYFNLTMPFNAGPASPNYRGLSLFDLSGKYFGRGLQHGECGLTFQEYRNEFTFVLGCGVRPVVGGPWQHAAMMLRIDQKLPMQFQLQPPGLTLALAGSEVTLVSKAELELDLCEFFLPSVAGMLDFSSGHALANQSLGRYHGAGLRNKECGVTLINVQHDISGFVECLVGATRMIRSLDFVELIVATSPEDVGFDTTSKTMDGGVFSARCWATNSRPVANITWLLDGKVVRQDSTNEAPVETEWLWNHEPRNITQHLLLNVTRHDNGKELVCQVGHMALPSGVFNIRTTVNVEYEPVFQSSHSEQTIIDEGNMLSLLVKAEGNPPVIKYTWYKNGDDNVTFAEGPLLNFVRLGVDDSGLYKCTAVNSVGSTAWTFKLSVIAHDKNKRIIAGITCALLVVALGVLVAFLRFYKRLYWSGGLRLLSQDVEPVKFDNTNSNLQ